MIDKEFSIVELEDNYITKPNDFRRHRPGLYPTEASVEYVFDDKKLVAGTCMRASWYRSMQNPNREPASAGLMQKAHLGKWDEMGVVNRWKEMGIWVSNNIKFYNKRYFISGEMDAIVKNPETDALIGLEVKSYYGYPAGKMIRGAKRDKIPGVPKDNQFLQSILYAWEYKDELDEYRMYYIERGDGDRVEFRIGAEQTPDSQGKHQVWWQQIESKGWNFYSPNKAYQPYCIEDIYERYDQLINKLKNKELPPKDFSNNWDTDTVEWMWKNKKLGKTKYQAWQKNPGKYPCGDWHCDYCSYKNQCVQDELATVIKN